MGSLIITFPSVGVRTFAYHFPVHCLDNKAVATESGGASNHTGSLRYYNFHSSPLSVPLYITVFYFLCRMVTAMPTDLNMTLFEINIQNDNMPSMHPGAVR
jgi:hypothetical protein